MTNTSNLNAASPNAPLYFSWADIKIGSLPLAAPGAPRQAGGATLAALDQRPLSATMTNAGMIAGTANTGIVINGVTRASAGAWWFNSSTLAVTRALQLSSETLNYINPAIACNPSNGDARLVFTVLGDTTVTVPAGQTVTVPVADLGAQAVAVELVPDADPSGTAAQLAWAVVATSTQADGQLVAVLTPAPPQDAAPSVRVRPGTGVGLP